MRVDECLGLTTGESSTEVEEARTDSVREGEGRV